MAPSPVSVGSQALGLDLAQGRGVTHNPGSGIRSATLGTWAKGARNTGWCVKCHLFHRMPSTRSVPLASRIQLETPGVSWGGVGRASGGFAPDAGGCPGSGQGGALKQARTLSSKSLQGESSRQVGCSSLPLSPPFHPHPLLLGLGVRVLPGWS